VTVPLAEGNLNGLFNLVGAGLPCPKTNCWNLVASIKSEGFPVTRILLVKRLLSLGHVELFNDGEMFVGDGGIRQR
jgi:hypothetical protein